jgi:hypothetical protein
LVKCGAIAEGDKSDQDGNRLSPLAASQCSAIARNAGDTIRRQKRLNESSPARTSIRAFIATGLKKPTITRRNRDPHRVKNSTNFAQHWAQERARRIKGLSGAGPHSVAMDWRKTLARGMLSALSYSRALQPIYDSLLSRKSSR